MAVFDEFPYLRDEAIIIRKMVETDLPALREITCDPEVYRYCPHFLYRKSDGNLLAAIRNCGGRDFEKKKHIIAGICPADDPGTLIGLAEMFDYRKHDNCMTIGYKVNPKYWHRGIATHAVSLMKKYLFLQDVKKLHAYVMPENVYSERALLRNGFVKLPDHVPEKDPSSRKPAAEDHFEFL